MAKSIFFQRNFYFFVIICFHLHAVHAQEACIETISSDIPTVLHSNINKISDFESGFKSDEELYSDCWRLSFEEYQNTYLKFTYKSSDGESTVALPEDIERLKSFSEYKKVFSANKNGAKEIQNCVDRYRAEISWLKQMGTTCSSRKDYIESLKEKNSLSLKDFSKEILKESPDLLLLGENHDVFKEEKKYRVLQNLKNEIPTFNCLLLEMDSNVQSFLDLCISSKCPDSVPIRNDENSWSTLESKTPEVISLVNFAKKNKIKLIAIDDRKFGISSDSREHAMWTNITTLKSTHGCSMSVFSVGKSHIRDQYYREEDVKNDVNYKTSNYLINGLKTSKTKYISLNIETVNPTSIPQSTTFPGGHDWKSWYACKEKFTVVPPPSGAILKHQRTRGAPIMDHIYDSYKQWETFDATLFIE